MAQPLNPALRKYRFPTNSYLAIRDSGEERANTKCMAMFLRGTTRLLHGCGRSFLNILPLDTPEQPEFYGLGNGVTDTVKVDKDTARRVQYNHIMYVMRHFLTTDEKYGSSGGTRNYPPSIRGTFSMRKFTKAVTAN